MAYDPNNLSVVGFARPGYPGADGHTIWRYASPVDPMTVIEAGNYFAEAASMMRPGDAIHINAMTSSKAAARTHQDGIAFVKEVEPGMVRIVVACRA